MRLRRSDRTGPGLRRIRRGRRFSYVDASGKPVTDPATLDRIRGLVIPPAWRDVWICEHPNGHIHTQWRRARDEEKHDRVLELASRLSEVRAKIHADLCLSGLDRERILAGALRVLDRGVFRTGGEEYTEENDSHGVATLLREHVCLRSGELIFDFPAKNGIERAVGIRDPELARLIVALRRGRRDGERLFAYRNGSGKRQELRARDVNERFKELAGEEFTVKDMRTWTATVLAATEFAAQDPPKSQRATKRTEAAMMRLVAEQLGNTAAVARRSYVDPRVCELFRKGRTIDLDGDTTREGLEDATRRLLTT